MNAPTAPPRSELMHRSRLREGSPFPLGATWTGLGVNFALFAGNATKVELCIFGGAGSTEIERIEQPTIGKAGAITSANPRGICCDDGLTPMLLLPELQQSSGLPHA